MRFVLLACAVLLSGCASDAAETLVRGTPPLDRSPAAALSADDFTAGTFTARDGTTLPYRLLAPTQIEPGRRYPLVVQFHGSGAIGNDNRAQIERDFAARAWASALTHVPLLILHGDADTENPIASDREMVAAILAAGGKNIRLRSYVGLQHLPPGDLVPGDWWRDWLFAQHRKP